MANQSNAVKQSQAYLLGRTGWRLSEETVQILDAPSGLWVGRMTTTHLAAYGEAEQSFTVVANGYDHFILSDDVLPALGQWIEKYTAR